MALASYSDLVTAVALLLNRDDLTGSIPDFIRLCEASVDAREDLAIHRRRICRSEAIIDEEYEALPDDYLSIQSINIKTPLVQLYRAEPEQFVGLKLDEAALQRRIEADLGVSPAPPRYYTIVGTEIRFLPVPQQEYTLQMTVYERLPALESYETNWLLQFYPNIYLYGAAIHSAPFLKDDARLALWESLYERACEMAAKADPLRPAQVELRTEMPALAARRIGCF